MIGVALGFLGAGVLAASLVAWFHMLGQVALEGRRWMVFSAIGLAIGLAVAALTQEPGFLGGVPAVLTALLGSGFLFLAVLAPQSSQTAAVGVGEPALDFTALTENGEPFELASLKGSPLLLKFFRGHW